MPSSRIVRLDRDRHVGLVDGHAKRGNRLPGSRQRERVGGRRDQHLGQVHEADCTHVLVVVPPSQSSRADVLLDQLRLIEPSRGARIVDLAAAEKVDVVCDLECASDVLLDE